MKLPLPERIFLVGMPACGKSAVGEIFAKHISYSFCDLDKRIEAREGKKVSQIFKANGQPYFRELEREMLLQTFLEAPIVVACGGGTACFFDNMKQMKEQGTVVYLETSIETLTWRLKHGFGARPLFDSSDHTALRIQLTELFATRQPYYEQAHFVINAENDPLKVEEELLQLFS